MPEELNPETPVPNGTPKRRHSRPKGEERLVPTDLPSLRLALMREAFAQRPNPRILRVGERCLRSLEREQSQTVTTTEKDAEIERLTRELEELRARTPLSSVVASYDKQREELKAVEQKLRDENISLKNRVGTLTLENADLKARLDRVQRVLKSKSGEMWESIRGLVDAAESEADFVNVDALTAVAKECNDMVSELGVKSSERRNCAV